MRKRIVHFSIIGGIEKLPPWRSWIAGLLFKLWLKSLRSELFGMPTVVSRKNPQVLRPRSNG